MLKLFTRKEIREADNTVSDRLAEVERALRLLQLEWADTLDRLTSKMNRIARERQRLEEVQRESGESVQHLSDEDVAAGSGHLPHLDPVSERILARRNRLTHRVNGGS